MVVQAKESPEAFAELHKWVRPIYKHTGYLCSTLRP
jgi:hypothetical protein